MSDKKNNSQQPKEKQQSQQDEIKESLVEIEKRFLKLASIQTILSVAAVFTGLIALYAALTESYAVRKQTTASVWPYVQTVISDNKSGDSAYIRISLNNVGVGPAKMQGVRLQYKGKRVEDWDTFIHQLDSEAELGVSYGKSDVRDRVLAPQESLLLFQTEKFKLAESLQNAISQGELELSYCYCSIFDDCWLQPLADSKGEQITQAIDQCPNDSSDSSL